LVIDDSFLARKIIINLFSKNQGYEISEAGNGKEGLEKFKKICPDITFLDIQMPVWEELNVLKKS